MASGNTALKNKPFIEHHGPGRDEHAEEHGEEGQPLVRRPHEIILEIVVCEEDVEHHTGRAGGHRDRLEVRATHRTHGDKHDAVPEGLRVHQEVLHSPFLISEATQNTPLME